MDVVDRVRLSGPLAPHARGFAGELSRLGFTRYSSQKQLQLAAHVSRWLDDAGLGTADLDAGAVDGFLAVRGGSVIRAGHRPASAARDDSSASEADADHGVQLDAVRRLPGHVVDLIEEAEPAERDPLVHVLPARGGI